MLFKKYGRKCFVECTLYTHIQPQTHTLSDTHTHTLTLKSAADKVESLSPRLADPLLLASRLEGTCSATLVRPSAVPGSPVADAHSHPICPEPQVEGAHEEHT